MRYANQLEISHHAIRQFIHKIGAIPQIEDELRNLAGIAVPASKYAMKELGVRRKADCLYYAAQYHYKTGCYIPVILVISRESFALITIRTDQDWRGRSG